MTGGSERAHLQGMGAGVFENFMSKVRGQQPLWPSSGINNVGVRVSDEGGMKRWGNGSKNRDSGKGEGRLKGNRQSQKTYVG